MALSPRALASLSPTEILARDKEGFPQKSSITFGEVVSTFSRCGSVVSKRHGGIYISKSLKIPNCCSTISDNTLKLEPNFRDIGDSLRFSPRSSIRTAPLARSRTPSPCSSRRPRSLPVTPRSSTAQSQRYREPRRDFHERLKDAYAPPGGPLEMEAGTAFRPSLPEPGAATSSFNRGNPGGTASAAVTPGGGSCHGTTSGTLTVLPLCQQALFVKGMAIKVSTGSRAPAFWLRLALLYAFLLDRSAASFAKSGTGPSVVATSGSLSPPDLSEPNELDLLDDSEMPMPQEHELRSDFKEDVRDKEEQFLKSEHLWAFLSFIIGYIIVQYVLGGSTRELDTKDE